MPREERERRYIAEWLLATYPQGNYVTNVPLGPIPQEVITRHGLQAGAALFRPQRLRVDGVVWLPDAYLLVEAKIRTPAAAVGQLLIYKALAEKTPDLPHYDGQPISLHLVVPWALEWIKQAAKAQGIELHVFLPAWAEDYVRSFQNYFTRDYRIARAERERLRKTFGLE